MKVFINNATNYGLVFSDDFATTFTPIRGRDPHGLAAIAIAEAIANPDAYTACRFFPQPITPPPQGSTPNDDIVTDPDERIQEPTPEQPS